MGAFFPFYLISRQGGVHIHPFTYKKVCKMVTICATLFGNLSSIVRIRLAWILKVKYQNFLSVTLSLCKIHQLKIKFWSNVANHFCVQCDGLWRMKWCTEGFLYPFFIPYSWILHTKRFFYFVKVALTWRIVKAVKNMVVLISQKMKLSDKSLPN